MVAPNKQYACVDLNNADEYSGAFSITSPAIGNLYSG